MLAAEYLTLKNKVGSPGAYVTFQYFPTDRKVASKISEVGSGWIRMTSLFRLKEENGRILVEQDDACLGNSNRIETIPEARKLLKQCKGPK